MEVMVIFLAIYWPLYALISV